MKLLHGSDFHVGLANYGREVEEFGRSFDAFVDTAIANAVDLAVASGDTFHGRRPGPKELRIVAAATRRLVNAKIPLVLSTGNHDGMATIADPDSQTLGWLDAMQLDGVYVGIRPMVIIVPGIAAVSVLPYAHKRAVDDPGLTLRERTDESSRILEESIAELSRRMTTFDDIDHPYVRLPRVFVGHLTTESASLGAEAAMQMGWDTTVDPAVFDPFDYAALGHIHVGQQVSPKAWYAGSPDVHGFGEEADDKRFLLVDVERGRDPIVTILPTSPRPLIRRVVSAAREWTEVDEPFPEGAVVELRLRPSGKMDARVARDLVDAMRKRGALFVQTVVEEPEQVRSRSRALEAEAPVTDQVDAWLATQDAPESTKARAREIAVRALSVQ
ncbi:MAG: metallophosphoesterase family protein [Limnohabitans sp.]